MWNTSEIKKKGLKILKNNFWTLFFLGLFMSIAIEKYMINNDAFSNLKILYNYLTDNKIVAENESASLINVYADQIVSQLFTGNVEGLINKYNEKHNISKGVVYTVFNIFTKGQAQIQNTINSIIEYGNNERVGFIIASAIGILIRVLLVYPIRIGENRIYLESINYKKTRIRKITYAFKRDRYWNSTKTVLLMEIRKFLWNITIIGGVIKNYSYKMVTYVIAENPYILPKDAIKISEEMMKGNKFKAFKLDLSFLGWIFLQYITFGFLGIIVSPYYTATYTALYSKLREEYINNKGYKYELLNDNKLYEATNLEKYPSSNVTHKKRKFVNYYKKYELTSLVLFFFIFAFIGWLWEVLLYLFRDGILVNRGTLHGPWLPIYGWGCTIIIILTRFKRFRKLLKNPTVTFVAIVLICSIIEYVTSWAIEMATGLRYWDYTGVFLNINGRICFECSMFFGVGGALCVYIVAPYLERKMQKLTKKFKVIICTILVALIAVDNVYSLKNPNVGEGITEVIEKEKSQQ